MKKTVLLFMMFLALLFSCSEDTGMSGESEAEDVTTSVQINLVTSRDSELDVTEGGYDEKTTDELYWTYTAVKTSGGFSTGESEEDEDGELIRTPLNGYDEDGNPLMGIPSGTFGSFSYGSWIFNIEAYYLDDDGNEVTFYDGVDSEAVLSSSNNLVSCTVTLREASEKDTGTLIIYGIDVYKYDDDPSSAETFDFSNTDKYTLRYDLGDDYSFTVDEDFAMMLDEDNEDVLTFELDPGYYPLTIYLVYTFSEATDDADEDYELIAVAEVEDPGIYIRSNTTSTVTGYLHEGYTTPIVLKEVTLTYTSYELDTDGKTTLTEEVVDQLYPDYYTVAEGDYTDLGKIGITSSMAVLEDDSRFALNDDGSTFYCFVTPYTYLVTLDNDDYTYTTELISTTYTADDSSVDLGDVVLSASSGTATVDGEGEYTPEEDAFTYETESVVYTITLNSDFTYTTVIVTETFTSGDAFGEIVVTSGTTATVDGAGSYEVTETDDGYTLDYTVDVVVYTVTLSTDDYSYTYVIAQETYSAASSGATDIGSIIVYSGSTADVGSQTGLTVSSEGTISYITDDVTYLITLNQDGHTYTTVDAVSYTGSLYDEAFVVTEGYASADGTTKALEEDGTLYWTKGSVTYIISFDITDYTYTTTVYSTVYTAGSDAADLGSIVVYSDHAEVMDESCDILDDGTIEYQASDNETYVITTEDEGYTYSTVLYVTYSNDEVLGDIVVNTSTGEAAVGGETLTVGDDGVTISYTSDSVSYTITLSDDYTYTAEVAATYTVSSSATDYELGAVLVVDGTTATVNGKRNLAVTDSTITYAPSSSYYYVITLSDDYTYIAVLYETYTGNTLGEIVVKDKTVATVEDTEELEVSDDTIIYQQSENKTYTITLQSDYCYTTVLTETYTSDGTNDLGSVTVTSSVATVSGEELTVSDSAVTYEVSDSLYYVITLNSDYTYTADEYTLVTYTDSNGSYGDIVATVKNSSSTSYNTGDDFVSDSSNGYGETLVESDSGLLLIDVGYVNFLVELGDDGTYTATELYSVDELLCGYGTYNIAFDASSFGYEGEVALKLTQTSIMAGYAFGETSDTDSTSVEAVEVPVDASGTGVTLDESAVITVTSSTTMELYINIPLGTTDLPCYFTITGDPDQEEYTEDDPGLTIAAASKGSSVTNYASMALSFVTITISPYEALTE